VCKGAGLISRTYAISTDLNNMILGLSTTNIFAGKPSFKLRQKIKEDYVLWTFCF
jgi:hypothetical protein